jgi:hypothetical protein
MNVQSGSQYKPGQEFQKAKGAIIKSQPLGEEFTTANITVRKLDEDARASLRGFSANDSSEFAPVRAMKMMSYLEAANAVDKLQSTGDFDASYYFTAYEDASHDFEVAKLLKQHIYLPMINHAQRTGRNVERVREDLKTAIAEHIDLSKYKVRRPVEVQMKNLNSSSVAIAA